MQLRPFAILALVSGFLVAACGGDTPSGATPTPAPPANGVETRGDAPKRVIYYVQGQFIDKDKSRPVSLAPIWAPDNLNPNTQKPYVTDVVLGALHLLGTNDPRTMPEHGIAMNDDLLDDAAFDTLWSDAATLRSKGVTVRAMLGGGCSVCEDYKKLFTEWDTYYPILKTALEKYKFDGLDLDIEDSVALDDVKKIIDQLSLDFGPSFILSMAPVSTALHGETNLSGTWSYDDLYRSPQGAKIAYYNAQIYFGSETLRTTGPYEAIIANGYAPNRVVAGMGGSPADVCPESNLSCSLFVDMPTVAANITKLAGQYQAPGQTFGGVFVWEYHDAAPGGAANPAAWAVMMGKAMGL